METAELHLKNDRFAPIKVEYESAGPERSIYATGM